jgi:hypothetical protein
MSDNKKYIIGGVIFALVVVVIIVIVASTSSSSKGQTSALTPALTTPALTTPALTTPAPPNPADYEVYGPNINVIKKPEIIKYVPAINKYVAVTNDVDWIKMVDLDMTINKYAPQGTVFDPNNWNTYNMGGSGYKIRKIR